MDENTLKVLGYLYHNCESINFNTQFGIFFKKKLSTKIIINKRTQFNSFKDLLKEIKETFVKEFNSMNQYMYFL